MAKQLPSLTTPERTAALKYAQLLKEIARIRIEIQHHEAEYRRLGKMRQDLCVERDKAHNVLTRQNTRAELPNDETSD